MSDPDCLEGRGRTPEQMAADHRALQEVAPTAADKFVLMFGHQRPTPETEEAVECYNDLCDTPVGADFASRLERQRDELQQDLEFRRDLYKLLEQRLGDVVRRMEATEKKHEKVLDILAEVLDDWRGEWRPSESTSYQRAAALLQES